MNVYIGLVVSTVFLVLSLALPYIAKTKLNFLFYIPILNALADVTVYYFPSDSINSGLIRAAIILVFVFAALPQIRLNATGRLIVLFMCYLLALSLFSSDTFVSLQVFLKVLISFMMFPLARFLVRDISDFRKLTNSIWVAVAIIVLQLIVAQIFKLGTSYYLQGTFYMGGGLVQLSYLIVNGLLLLPLYLQMDSFKRRKILVSLTALAAGIFLLLILRRSAIAAVALGFAVYFLLTNHKMRLAKYLAVGSLFLYFTFPWYGEELVSRYDKRSQRQFEEEGRVVYTKIVIDEFLHKSMKHSFLGSELFNSVEYFEGRRGLHTDFNVILHGAGAIGFLLFLAVHVAIALDYRRVRQRLVSDKLWRELNAVFWSLALSSIFVSFSGSLTSIGYRSSLFLLMGAMVGMTEKQAFHAGTELAPSKIIERVRPRLLLGKA